MEPPFFELRLDERRDFLLPPFFADAFLREARLFGAMVLNDLGLRVRETSSNCERGRKAQTKFLK